MWSGMRRTPSNSEDNDSSRMVTQPIGHIRAWIVLQFFHAEK